MQYSQNSNEAIRAVVRACPTPIGQYRQAVLQLRDRTHALKQFEFSCERQRHEIKILEAEREKLIAVEPGDVIDTRIRNSKVALIELDIAERQMQLKVSAELVDDARREVQTCNLEIQRLEIETGIQFDRLTDDDFQLLMAEEFRQKRTRWIAARTLAARTGFPVEAAEALFEIPAEERSGYLTAVNAALAEFEKSLPAPEPQAQLTDGAN